MVFLKIQRIYEFSIVFLPYLCYHISKIKKNKIKNKKYDNNKNNKKGLVYI